MSRSSEAAAAGLMLLALAGAAGLAQENDEELGRRVFVELAEPQCSLCHTLGHAGSEGEIGPNLDDLKPTAEQVRRAVVEGIEAMPAYGGLLEDEAIAAVAEYVAAVAGKR